MGCQKSNIEKNLCVFASLREIFHPKVIQILFRFSLAGLRC